MQRLRNFLKIMQNAVGFWTQSNAFSLAGSLAFYTLFSLAPVVIIAVTIIGVVLGEDAAQGQIVAQLQDVMGEEAARVVENAVASSRIQESGLFPTIAGVITLMIGATTVFAQMQFSLNAIWSVTSKPSRNNLFILLKARLFSLMVVVSIGFVLLVSLLMGVALRAILNFTVQFVPFVEFLLGTTEVLIALAVMIGLFTTIFKVLPDVQLRWRDVLLGAIVTALLFSLGRYGISAYLAYTATASAYGAAGSVVLVLLWVYYSSLILLFGAAFTRSYLEFRGQHVRPSDTAVVVNRQLVEEGEVGEEVEEVEEEKKA